MERAAGIAPALKPWKGVVLLLHYARLRPAKAGLRRGNARRKGFFLSENWDLNPD